MAEIIPAIIPKQFFELEEKIELVKGIVPIVQVDILDGKYTPEASWPYKKQDIYFEEIQKEARGMPFWENVDYEFDLMVKNPEDVVFDWVTAGATRIIIHVDSTEKVPEIIEKLKNVVEIGLAVGIHTPLEKIDPYINSINFVQCMGIERIGFQGEKFDERVIEKIKTIKTKYPNMVISVDGGVTLETAPLLIDAGVTRLVAGSAIYESDNYVDAIHSFKNL